MHLQAYTLLAHSCRTCANEASFSLLHQAAYRLKVLLPSCLIMIDRVVHHAVLPHYYDYRKPVHQVLACSQ